MINIKIPSFHPKPLENEIYIKNDRPLAVYIKRAKKLALKGFKCIKIYALSSALRKSIILT